MNAPIIVYQFDTATVGLILEGLGQLPHDRVRGTVDGIRDHLITTLQEHRAAQEREQKEQLAARKKPRTKKDPAP